MRGFLLQFYRGRCDIPVLAANIPDPLNEVSAITPQTQTRMLEILDAAHQAGHDVTKVYGFKASSTPEHNTGRALDMMVYQDKAMGDWLADYIWANRVRLGLKWLIWQQRIRSTSPGHSGDWEPMADRGSPTANHRDHIHSFYQDAEVKAMLTGPDISSHQPDWTPAPTDSFVFVKCTEGQSYVNPSMKEQADRADKAGLVVGWYHFLWPEFDRQTATGTGTSTKKVSGSPEVQAQWFIQNLADLLGPGDLLALDWEHAGSFTKGQPGGHASFEEKNRFLAEVNRLRPDLKCGLYCNRFTWNASDKQPGSFLWIAEYVKTPTITEPWVFHQYSDRTTAGQSLDQNVANFDTVQALRDWITPPPNPQEPDMALSQEDIDKIAAAVWGSKAADVVPAPDANVTNPDWKPASYLRNIYLLVREVRDLVKKLK